MKDYEHILKQTFGKSVLYWTTYVMRMIVVLEKFIFRKIASFTEIP